MTQAWKSTFPSGLKFVLLALCDNANDQGECYPSIPTLAAKCSMSERSVQRHIMDMEEAGILKREMRTGRSTIYHIDPRKFDTPDKLTPPTQCHPTPDTMSPPPPTQCHHGGDMVSPITIIEPPIEPSSNRQKRTRQKSAEGLGVEDLVSLGVEQQVARDWLAIRSKKRLPLTVTALEETVAQVRRAGMEMPSAIRLCCARGWAGFNADWVERRSTDRQPALGQEKFDPVAYVNRNRIPQ